MTGNILKSIGELSMLEELYLYGNQFLGMTICT